MVPNLSENLKNVLDKINKDVGEGTILTLDSRPRKVDVIPTGLISVDYALGTGGIPLGRIIEIYGHEQSGKSTLSQYIAGHAQRMGGTVAYIDMEHALDPNYAEQCGVDLTKLLLSQPDSAESALMVAERLIRSGEVMLVIVDSVAALVPQKELEADFGDSMVGVHARFMSQAMRKLTGALSNKKVAMIFTNQIRQKIGVMFGNPETTPGGLALKFYASVRIEMRKGGAIKDTANVVVGNEVKLNVVKNKLAPPYRKTTFNIFYEQGEDTIGNLLTFASDIGVIDRKGAYYYLGEEKLGQGFVNSRDTMLNNPELVDKVMEEVKKMKYIPRSEDDGSDTSTD